MRKQAAVGVTPGAGRSGAASCNGVERARGSTKQAPAGDGTKKARLSARRALSWFRSREGTSAEYGLILGRTRREGQ